MNRYILLIDDDEDEMQIFSEALDEINKPMSCIQSTSASAAMAVLTYLIPDYIFLDLNMPGINGLKCLEQIRKIKNLDDVPVILCSTFLNEDIQKKAMISGATACIKKPRKVSTLTEILKGIFSINAPF
jgi:CheY-like chemotaxis protein